jgi:hypothetical protein
MLKLKYLIVFLTIGTVALAQRNNQDYRFTTEFSQYIFGNIPVSIEKIVAKKVAVGIDLGVRFATKKSGTFENQNIFPFTNSGVYDYTNQNTFNRFYNAYTIGIHFKYYFNEKRIMYMEPMFYYRYWYFNEKDVRFTRDELSGGFSGYFFDGNRNENQKDFVFGMNIGSTIRLKQKRRNTYVMDFEVGLGLIDRAYTFYTASGTVKNEPVRAYTEKGFGKHPYINVGLIFGIER